jgi:hypothetical protein
MVHTSIEAAKLLDAAGISVEIVDLQTIVPLDWDSVFASVRKTSRLVVVRKTSPLHRSLEVAARSPRGLLGPRRPDHQGHPPHTHIPSPSSRRSFTGGERGRRRKQTPRRNPSCRHVTMPQLGETVRSTILKWSSPDTIGG